MPDPSQLDVLLVGSGGMLGRAWARLLTARHIRYRTADRPTLDLARPETIASAVTPGVTHVINCAAYTDVDGAEAGEAFATNVNGDGVGALAERCQHVGSTLVHYSTDYVFAGTADSPYPTDGPLEPLNAYGRGKAAGERAIETSGCAHLIVRTSWLYAPWGNNFVLTMVRLSRDRDIEVVDDQVGRPTSATYLTERTLALVEASATGRYHVTDGGQCSWHEFTTEIVKVLGRKCSVARCSSEAFQRKANRAAKRPAYSVLDLSKTDRLIGPSRPWQENLLEVLSQVEPDAAK